MKILGHILYTIGMCGVITLGFILFAMLLIWCIKKIIGKDF